MNKPIKDKAFEVVVACQVWEHLEGRQREAFQEMKRISQHLILTLPWQWRTGDYSHVGLSHSALNFWSQDTPYRSLIIIPEPKTKQRCVVWWAFP